MRKAFRSGALALIGLAAPAAALTPAAAEPAAAAAPHHAAASAGPAGPGLYHMPVIGKVKVPGALGSLLGHGVRRAPAVQAANWSGYADTHDTVSSVASSWTEPTVNAP